MSKAFRCDFCKQLFDGEPDKVPEQWLLAPRVEVELNDRRITMQVETNVKHGDAMSGDEICNGCQRAAVIDALHQLTAIYQTEEILEARA